MTYKNPCYPWQNQATQAAFKVLTKTLEIQKRYLETCKQGLDARFILSRTMEIKLFDRLLTCINYQQLADHANQIMHRG